MEHFIPLNHTSVARLSQTTPTWTLAPGTDAHERTSTGMKFCQLKSGARADWRKRR